MKRPKVLVALLTGNERQSWVNPDLALMLCSMSKDSRFDVNVRMVKDARPVEVARNLTIKLARDTGQDFLVTVDNDNFMYSGTPLDVIAAAAGTDRAVIGLTYAIWRKQNEVQWYPPNHDPNATGDWEEVQSVGGGVLIVHRCVWEKIPPPWFQWRYGEVDTLDVGPDGWGEDYFFCQLVRRHGFKVWTHRTIIAGHYRTVNLTGMASTFAQMGAGKSHCL